MCFLGEVTTQQFCFKIYFKKTPEDSLLRQGIVQLRRMTSRDGQFPSVAGSSNRTNSFQYQMHFLVSCLGCNKVRAIEFKAKKTNLRFFDSGPLIFTGCSFSILRQFFNDRNICTLNM